VSIMGLSEPRLLMISSGLSLTAGISAAFFAWLHPGALSKTFTSIACGFGIYRLVLGFLGSVRFDVVTPYGFTPDTWGWAVNGIAIAAALLQAARRSYHNDYYHWITALAKSESLNQNFIYYYQ
ncbi:MAG: hypothetical protein WBA07_09880, partial [Rivularia sp. (in: cyanobacteria)]